MHLGMFNNSRSAAWRVRIAVLALFALAPLCAAAEDRSAALAEYEGRYAYHDGQSVDLVADGPTLVAILGEGKYPLRRVGPDLFENGGGDRIPFVRNPAGRVVAFREDGQTYERLSADVPPASRQLLRPRPPGEATDAAYRPPPSLDDGIATGSADTHALPPAIAETLVQGVLDGRYPDVHAILVFRGGRLLLEEYFYGYDRTRTHQMRSLTKTVIALLAGIAIDRGALQADTPMLDGLGDDTAASDPRKRHITLADLLSHRSGLACDDYDPDSPGRETALYEQADWIEAFTRLPVRAEPGEVAHYCSGGILAAGRMVERATGTALPDFAQAHLFGPLGIERDAWHWPFELDRRHRHEVGQIHLRPRDMLKLGLLIERRGLWNGERVISADWIDAMTTRQSRIGDNDYGLGLWHRWYHVETRSGPRRVDTVMLSGNGGQKVYLVPELDLVAVFTGGAFNKESPVNAMLANVLLPALLEARAPAQAVETPNKPGDACASATTTATHSRGAPRRRRSATRRSDNACRTCRPSSRAADGCASRRGCRRAHRSRCPHPRCRRTASTPACRSDPPGASTSRNALPLPRPRTVRCRRRAGGSRESPGRPGRGRR